MKNQLCDMLGIDIPIVQAPLGGAVTPELAAAVSNAGGLGTLPVWTRTVDDLRHQVRRTGELTNRPFAANLNMDFPQEERLNACLELNVPIISFFWQDPSALVSRAKDAGAIVMHTVGNADDARRAVDNGVDIIVAQGWEAGGHVRGTVSTMALIPAVVDAVGDVPVIAAGGIADGRGMAAALALGASGVWVGTRFLASEEVAIHPYYQRRILDAGENDTQHLENLFGEGWPDAPHRVIRNSTVQKWELAGRPDLGNRPGENSIVGYSPTAGDITRYRVHTPGKYTTGDIEALSMWAGQSAGIVSQITPAGQIVADMAAGARDVLGGLN